MTIPTYVGPSSIEGVGLFAAATVRAGEVIWVLDERLDLLLPAGHVAGLGPIQREFVERYGYLHMTRPEVIVVEFDNGRFMNHSDDPNTDFRSPDRGFAIRDVRGGEELTCNYAEFDPDYVMQPGRRFSPT